MNKPTTTLGVAGLKRFPVLASQNQKMVPLDSRMVKQCSPDIQTRNDAFRVQKVNGSCWIKSSSYSSVSHIVMDHLVKRPLSSARAVPELNPIARTTTKERSECRADNQGVSLSRVH